MASDVPAWLGGSAEAVSAVTALLLGIRGFRAQGARTWPALLEEISKKSPNELQTAVETYPWIAEIVGLAWEEAARTSSEQKRLLLARVAAAALRYGAATDKVESLPFLIRTVANLEPPHIQVLMAIATAASLSQDPQDNSTLRHNLGSLAAPIYGQLQREGLIRQTSQTWDVSGYGWEFLAYLAEDEPDARVAYVDFYSLSRDSQTGTLVLINRGTSPATVTDVHAEFYDKSADRGGDFTIKDFIDISLGAGEKSTLNFELPLHLKTYPEPSPLRPAVFIRLQWKLGDGRLVKAERGVSIPSFDEQGVWLKSTAAY